MFKIGPNITTDYILKYVRQEDIFLKYLGHVVTLNEWYINPLRSDERASCNYVWYENMLWFRDWAEDKSYNCFTIAAKYYSCSFKQALNKIAIDFNLIEGSNKLVELPKIIVKNKGATKIQVKRIPFTKEGLAYWVRFSIEEKDLKFYNIAQISHLWINENLITIDKIAFCYWFGKGYYKILQPFSLNHKWFSNTTHKSLQGFSQLPKTGDLLVITKALKDVICLYKCNIPAIAPSAESVILTESRYKKLSNRFKTIVSNFDYDYTGIKSMNKMKRLYNIRPYYFKDYGVKDIAEFVEMYDLDSLKKLINESI